MTCPKSHSRYSVRPGLDPQFSDTPEPVFSRQYSARTMALSEEQTGEGGTHCGGLSFLYLGLLRRMQKFGGTLHILKMVDKRPMVDQLSKNCHRDL